MQLPAPRRIVLGAAAPVLALSLLLGERAEPSGAQEGRTFRHADHVSTKWLGGETLRDCRGCHAFEDKGEAEAEYPVGTCEVCHYEQGMAHRFTTEADPDPARVRAKPVAGFTHNDHLTLECRSCHLPRDGRLDPLPIPSGAAECARCHAPGARPDFVIADGIGVGRADIERDLAGRLARKLNESPLMAPAGRFYHRDHLRDVETCSPCHDETITTRAGELGRKRFDARGCAECHETVSGGATVEVIESVHRSLAVLTFAHRDHVLPPGSRDANASTRTPACTDCHELASMSRGHGEVDWLYRTGPHDSTTHDYEGCVACHVLPSWQTKQHGDWGGCAGCHDFDGKSDAKTTRRMATVPRFGRVEFVIEKQVHPFITKDDRKEDCSECHRAPVEALPSRVATRPRRFDHATHLTKNPTREECLRCHAGIPKSESAADLGWPVKEHVRVYDVNACADCHKGSKVIPKEPAIAQREVTEFSHSLHLAEKTGLSCADCHDPKPAQDGRIGILPPAAACTKCHDHDEKGELWKNHEAGFAGEHVTSCARCHGANLPAAGAEPRGPGVRIAPAEGKRQHHPGDKACGGCHVGPALALAPLTQVTATGPQRPRHEFRDPDRANCLDCHWSRNTRSSLPKDPESRAVRRQWGSKMGGYPGGRGSSR